MKILEVFERNPIWHDDYDLPVCPSLNNPWIYGAYAMKVLRFVGLTADEEFKLSIRWAKFLGGCRIQSGLFNRWPDGNGGGTSHDELMGIAYLFPGAAMELISYLEKTDGVYTNKQDDAKQPDASIRFNVYRFPWFMPYMRAAAGYSVNPFSQIVFSFHLLIDNWNMKPGTRDPGGRLRIWIMCEAMERFSISRMAVAFWRSRMSAKGFTPRSELLQEPGEYPILSEYAPGEF